MSSQLDLALRKSSSTVVAEIPFTPKKLRKSQTTSPVELACDAALRLGGFDPEEVAERRNGLSAVVIEAGYFHTPANDADIERRAIQAEGAAKAVRDAALAKKAAGKPLDDNELHVLGLLPNDPEDGCVLVQEYKAEPPRFRIWTAAEIWEPLEEPDYAVGGIFVKTALAMICATGSSLKTWAIIDLAIAKATGAMWLGRFQCEAGPALIIDWESGDYELRRRCQLVSAARGLVGPVVGVEIITMPDVFFNSEDFQSIVTELARTRSIIMFDSLAAGSQSEDENDARFAGGLKILKRVATLTGCTFVVLHHSRKAKADGTGDEREMVRGSGAIFATCDVVLQLSRAKDDSMRVKQTKSRGGKAVDPFVIRVEDVGDKMTSVTATDADEEEDADVPIEKAKRAILVLLAKDVDLRSKNEIHRRVKGTKSVVLSAIDELTERQIVTVHMGVFRLRSEVT